MTKALQLAMTKAAALPEEAQEQLGREILERIEALNELRAAIEVGVRELDAGLGEELDMEEFLGQLHRDSDGRALEDLFGRRPPRRICANLELFCRSRLT